jgi:hypothetical protein
MAAALKILLGLPTLTDHYRSSDCDAAQESENPHETILHFTV